MGFRSANVAHTVSRICLAVLLAPLYVIGKLLPRDPSLWVFGNFKGYTDNPRYLLKYVRKNHPNVKAVWIARTPRHLAAARADGVPAFMYNSWRGMLVCFRAGVGVVASRLGDINRAAVGGMFVVNLWHGTPLKKILLDAPSEWKIGEGYLGRILSCFSKLLLRRAMRNIDLMTAPSNEIKHIFERAFALEPYKVPVTGFARTDILVKRMKEVDPASPRRILYAPTWRDTREAEEALWRGFDQEEWSALMVQHNTELLIKLHPLAYHDCLPSGIGRLPGVRVLPESECEDINTYYATLYALITDYSSTAFDFSIYDRPILFFTPDRSQYEQDRGFYFPLPEITGGLEVCSWQELLADVDTVLRGNVNRYLNHVRGIRNRFFAYVDQDNCKRIVDAINRRMSGAL